MAGRIDARLKELELVLPAAPAAVGAYVPVTRMGNLVVTSGQLPMRGQEILFAGKVGSTVEESEGASAAKICAMNALAQIKAQIGTLDKVVRIIRVEGYVASAPGFTAQPQVLNGASRLLVDIFGEAGKHTRIAVGVSELPLNASVELVIWAEVEA